MRRLLGEGASTAKLWVATATVLAIAALPGVPLAASEHPVGVAYVGFSDCAYDENQVCETPDCPSALTHVVCFVPHHLGDGTRLTITDATVLKTAAIICQDTNSSGGCQGGAAGDYSNSGCGDAILLASQGFRPELATYVFLGGVETHERVCNRPGTATSGLVQHIG